MVTYLDTQSGGVNNDLLQGGLFEWNLNLGTKFWLNVANNFVLGQNTGQSVTFKIQDIRGSQQVTVPYGKWVSRFCTGHLITTVPPVLPSTPEADLHIIIDDDKVPLAVQITGSGYGSGATTIKQSTAFTTGGGLPVFTTIYTCPPGYKAYLQLANFSSSDNYTVAIQTPGGNVDRLTPANITGSKTLGVGIGNDYVINPPVEIAAGESLVVEDSTNGGTGGTIGYTIKQEPL